MDVENRKCDKARELDKCFHRYYSPALKKWGLYWICLVLPEFCHFIIFRMKLEYLWGQLASVNQILYEASLGQGKGCIMFRDRLDKNSGFHGNRKRPLTYTGETNVSTFSLLLFYQIFSNLQVTRTGINSDEFEYRADRTTPYSSRCPLAFEKKNPIDLQLENGVSKLAHSFLIGSSSNLLVIRTGIKCRTSSNSGRIGAVTSELSVLEGELNFR